MGKKYNTVLSLKVNITDQTALSISIVHLSVLFGVYISSFCACVTEVSSCLLTDPNGVQKKCLHVSHFLVSPGCMGSRSTPWPTSCSCKQPPASRAPSRPSARASRTVKEEEDLLRERERRIIIKREGVTCM